MTVGLLKLGEQHDAQTANERFAQRPGKVYIMSGHNQQKSRRFLGITLNEQIGRSKT